MPWHMSVFKPLFAAHAFVSLMERRSSPWPLDAAHPKLQHMQPPVYVPGHPKHQRPVTPPSSPRPSKFSKKEIDEREEPNHIVKVEKKTKATKKEEEEHKVNIVKVEKTEAPDRTCRDPIADLADRLTAQVPQSWMRTGFFSTMSPTESPHKNA